MNKTDELINKWELQGMFSTPKIANQARAQIKGIVQQAVSEQKETMYLNMQYYMLLYAILSNEGICNSARMD